MKLRLIMRLGEEDSDGRCAGYQYQTVIVKIPDGVLVNKSGYTLYPEIIGGEWIYDGKAGEK